MDDAITRDAAPLPGAAGFGDLLRDWRGRRRLSQLALGLEAGVSARHISFLESGRSQPSRSMVSRLADGLDMPVAERNALFSAAGFAHRYRESGLDAADLAPAREALNRMMRGHSPYPAIVFDRHWTAQDANAAGRAFIGAGDGEFEPVNMIELLLTPGGLREALENWAEIAAAMRTRLIAESRHAGGDAVLEAYAARLAAALPEGGVEAPAPDGPFLTVKLATPAGPLAMFSTVAEISSPYDVTLADLRLELFFPADAAARDLLEAVFGAG